MPLGNVVDSNPDASSQDCWLVCLNDGNGNYVARNEIVASTTFVKSVVAPSYDYSVDVSVGGQPANVGDYYNPQTDTFSPPLTNWIEVVRQDMNSIVASLATILADASNLSATDLATAMSESDSDQSGGYTSNEASLIAAINSYVSGGG